MRAVVAPGQIRQTAENEALIGFAIDVIGLHAGAVARGCVGNIHGFAQAVGDERIAVAGRNDAPLLAEAAGERHTAYRRAIAGSHGLQGLAVHGIAENPESGLGGEHVPLLVIGVARRKLDDAGLIVAILVDNLAGSYVADFVASRAVESALRPRRER